MLVYKLSGCRFEFSCSHVNLRYRVFIFLMLLTYVSSLNFTVDENNDEKSLGKFLIWFWDEIRTTFYYSSVIRQMANLKKGVSRKQTTPNFPKTNIFYSLCTCAYQGVRNLCFLENMACFVFLKHLFSDPPFCIITDVSM